MKSPTTHSSPDRPGIRVKGLAECLDQDWHIQNENVWVDVQAPTPEQIETLKSHFAFNWLALDDALETEHWGRFERYPEHYFLIFRTLAEPKQLTDRISSGSPSNMHCRPSTTNPWITSISPGRRPTVQLLEPHARGSHLHALAAGHRHLLHLSG